MHITQIPKELSRLQKRVEELHNRNETLMKELEKASQDKA
jgi:prefoldin subunit 5